MNEQDKEAFERWFDDILESCYSHDENGIEATYLSVKPHMEQAWQAALDFRDNGLDERFAKIYMEGMKTGELKERERSKKLVEALDNISNMVYDYDLNGIEIEAKFALKEYRGEK